jgi:hypothetical protein
MYKFDRVGRLLQPIAAIGAENYWRRAALLCDSAMETVSLGCIGLRSNHLAISYAAF